MHLKELAKFSAVKYLTSDKTRFAGLFEGEIQRKSMFECVCGKSDGADVISDDKKIKCVECGIVQHKVCVRFLPEKMGRYLCPHCNVRQPKIESKATLIVAPSAISAQWIEEVHKLVDNKSLRVKFYE